MGMGMGMYVNGDDDDGMKGIWDVWAWMGMWMDGGWMDGRPAYFWTVQPHIHTIHTVHTVHTVHIVQYLHTIHTIPYIHRYSTVQLQLQLQLQPIKTFRRPELAST